jgi:hypothetical protein
VAFSNLDLPHLRTRQQVRTAVLGTFGKNFLVVDFEGVHSISNAAAHELFLKLPNYAAISVQPINLEPLVAQAIRHARLIGHSQAMTYVFR